MKNNQTQNQQFGALQNAVVLLIKFIQAYLIAFALVMLASICLTSCSPCKDFIKKIDCNEMIAYALKAQHQKPDTIIQYRDTTIHIESAKTDSFYIYKTDTNWVTIYRDNVRIKYQWKNDTIREQIKCPEDSIIARWKETTIRSNFREGLEPINKSQDHWLGSCFFWIIVGAIALVCIFLMWKYRD